MVSLLFRFWFNRKKQEESNVENFNGCNWAQLLANCMVALR